MSTTNHDHHIYVLMGVSGSGKSAVASEVAHQLNAAFLDGDFLHPRSNILKMASGEPLNDDDRTPWLKALNDAAFAMQRTNKVSLIVCSALKKHYRDLLRDGNPNLSFIYMKGDFEVIESRLKARKGHFFKTQMLVTQFETLQEPQADEKDVLIVDIDQPLDGVVASTLALINQGQRRVSTLTLVLTAVGSVLLLLFLVMKARMHAFVALMVVSIGAGLFSGMPLDKIADTMQKGMGGTLGFLAIVVALGAMFGKILHETGAVDQIAVKMLKSFGHSRAHYAIGLAGLICALPLFFEVAIVLLISVAFSMARHTGTNLVKLVIPLFAGVAAAAAFLLPGPAPMLLASQMHADFGWMILIGLCAAIPGMIIAGPLFGNFISKFVSLEIPDDISEPHLGEGKLPSFGFSLSLILLPLVLVGLKTIAARFTAPGSTLYEWLEFIGHPFTAILVACLVAIYGLAYRQGMDKEKVMAVCGQALQPAGIILLVIGAGGVFKQVLVDSGVGPALGEALTGMGLPIAITCFVLAAAVRIIQGSATVACLTAVGLVMPVIEQLNYNGAQMAALSICIAGGSIVVSHVNDAGFWLFGKFTGATEAQTLKTWTMMETILGTTGAIVGMIAFSLLS
ncbi:Gnt-I system [Cedecea neteri]|uniref:gluconokinase n=4 Tax=Gammaproteobacteria TaxID=1236 RepID=A0A2X2T3R0_9ENTR|nr:Gnt-I system [Cedecea neteri]